MRGLYLRADASTRIGTGHVMRCLALAAPWVRAKTPVTLAAAELPRALIDRVASAGAIFHQLDVPAGSPADAEEMARLSAGSTLVVVDGYHFDAAFQRTLVNAGRQVLWMDDFDHAGAYCAAFVLNPSLAAHESLYARREATTELLLGPRHALLREEFLKWRQWQRPIPDQAVKFVVTMGGTDPDLVTAKVIDALRLLVEEGRLVEATIVVGGGNPHFAELAQSIRSLPWIRLLRSVEEMAPLMAEADMAITAGGTTVWEMACLGLPNLVIVLAENQRENAAELAANGIAENLGWHAELTAESMAGAIHALAGDRAAREGMSRRGRALVDGWGSQRVWLRVAGEEIVLRPAASEDIRMLWEWANDPLVRSASFSSHAIAWPEHEAWFRSQIQREDRILWIADDSAGTLGQVRFGLEGDRAVISASLDPRRRGNSLGPLLIGVACRRLFELTPVSTVVALIKPENRASIRAFEHAGFVKTGLTEVKGISAASYQLDRSAAIQ